MDIETYRDECAGHAAAVAAASKGDSTTTTTTTTTTTGNTSPRSMQRMKKMAIQSSSERSSYCSLVLDTLCCRGSTFGLHLMAKCDVLIAGQVLSFLMACSGAAQASLSLDCKLKAPMFTVGLFYVGLAVLLVRVVRPKASQSSDAAVADIDKDDDGSSSSGTTMTFESPQSHDSATLPSPDDTADRIRSYESHHDPSASTLMTPLSFKFWEKSKTYLPMSALDIYANYVVMRGFQYTTLTSVTLLDALAIPSALILSKLFLQRYFTKLHLMGVALCVTGILLNISADYNIDKRQPESLVVQQYPYMMLGDSFAAIGGLLVGASNVVQEVSVRTIGGPDEYLGMLGFWATVIAFVHCSLFEREEITEFFFASDSDRSETCTGATAWWILAVYFVSNVALYIGTAQFLQVSEATFYNLSLLTGDVWSVVFSVAAQGILPGPLFYVALAGTVSGVIVYEMAPSPILEDGEHQSRAVMHSSHIELGQLEGFRDDMGSDDGSLDVEGHELELTTVVIC